MPCLEGEVHVEHVVGADGQGRGAVEIDAGRSADDEPEGRAPAGRARNLHEREVLAAGEKPDPFTAHGCLTDGAGDPIEGGLQSILRIHSRGV